MDPARRTETFAEIELELDNWRWPGTVFRLRTGKALRRDRMEVAVHFRHVPHLPFGHTGEAHPNVLRFGLDPETLTLELTGIGARARTLVPLTLAARLDPPNCPPTAGCCLTCWTGTPPCPSATTKPKNPGASSRPCFRPGPKTWYRSRSTPRARDAPVSEGLR